MWYQHMGLGIGGLGWAFGPLLAALALWSLIWKGMALWKAARLGQNGWFIALLILNTAGILDIIYIYIIAKKSKVVVTPANVPPPTV